MPKMNPSQKKIRIITVDGKRSKYQALNKRQIIRATDIGMEQGYPKLASTAIGQEQSGKWTQFYRLYRPLRTPKARKGKAVKYSLERTTNVLATLIGYLLTELGQDACVKLVNELAGKKGARK